MKWKSNTNIPMKILRGQKTYEKLKYFGAPKWKRTKRTAFSLEEPVEADMEAIRKNIAEQICTKAPYELFHCFFDDAVVKLYWSTKRMCM